MMSMLTAVLLFADSPAGYQAQIEQWRTQREVRLKAEDGWLTVAGLFWLKPGSNSIGTSEDNRVVLPKGAPERVGSIEFAGGKSTLRINPGVPAAVNGKTVATAELRADADKGGPDQVRLGDVTFYVIKRGERYGVRMKDKNSEFRRNFKGLDWFPVAPEWRIEGRWVAYPQPKKVVFDSMTGDKEEATSPGYAVFQVGGKDYKLEPTLEGTDDLFFVFRDRTAGKTTYPAARFLYAKLPKSGGTVVLDFNKAYNPPCAFTPYATCPLPTPGNRLPIEISAGEKKYKGGSH